MASFPSIVFVESDEVNNRGFTTQEANSQGSDVIRDIPNLVGVKQFAPEQKSLRLDFWIYTNLQLDQMRLPQDFASFFANDLSLKSYGLDYECDIRFVKRINTARNKDKSEAGGQKDKSDTNVATGTFDILGVLFFNRESKDVPLVAIDGVSTDINEPLI